MGDVESVARMLDSAGVQGALYLNINNPQGIGIVAAHEDPSFFASTFREVLHSVDMAGWEWDEEFTMFGRTYTIGYETDLDHVLVDRPVSRIVNPEWPWAVWYPLKRSGSFSQLPEKEQKGILAEHGMIGNAFGQADYAHDIRLSCHGMDKYDNDFIVGLVGKELYPLTAVVQTMRKTRQTAEFLENLGPFFIGKAVWQSKS